MPHLSTPASFLQHARRGALLLALGAAGPAAWGQSFGPVSTYSTGVGSTPSGVALKDVNGDGRVDIISAHRFSNSVGIFSGQAGGGFTAVTSYPVGAGANGVAVGDINADGYWDIIVGSGTTVRVLPGQAGGGFASADAYTAGQTTSGINAVCSVADVALGDVNADGRLDIVSANSTANTVGVLLGLAGGGFAPFTAYSTGTGSIPVAVSLSDMDGDGRLDIVTATARYNSVGVLLGQAGGTFAPVINYAIGANIFPIDAVVGDVNGDGRPDIVTANVDNISSASVLLGQANGFAPASTYATGPGSQPYGVALGDVNGDGRLDIVTANVGTSSVGVLLGLASGLAPIVAYSTGTSTQPQQVTVGDINGDGRPDIVSTNTSANGIGVLLNTGTYTPLATARPTAAPDVTLAPNPAHGGFTVQLPPGLNPTQAELLNALGQVVRCPAVGSAASFRVETSGLAPGLYTLRLQAGGAALARRVAVE